MLLVIVKDGVYNDAFGNAQERKAGDEHETSVDYGLSLIDSGFAKVQHPAPLLVTATLPPEYELPVWQEPSIEPVEEPEIEPLKRGKRRHSR